MANTSMQARECGQDATTDSSYNAYSGSVWSLPVLLFGQRLLTLLVALCALLFLAA